MDNNKLPFDAPQSLNPTPVEDEAPLPPEEKIPITQSERILRKFGGARRLARVLEAVGRPYNPSSIFRWTYSKEKQGTGGVIPSQAWADIFLAARYEGVMITAEDLDPREKFMNSKKILAFPPVVRKRKGRHPLE